MTLYQGEFSTISYDGESGILTLVWSENTANMKAEDFQAVSSAFAEQAEKHNAQKLLVEVTNFRFPAAMGPELTAWRAETIVPKYHKAGVKRFAFVHGKDFKEPPTSGQPIEGENFITRHLGDEAEARAWLLEG